MSRPIIMNTALTADIGAFIILLGLVVAVRLHFRHLWRGFSRGQPAQ